MKVQQFLSHYGIHENPFGQEDAQTDHVFRKHLDGTRHPAWDKIYSSPENPATAVVFGEKGSGKTALRLQIAGQLADHNRSHPDARAFVIEYDDFNPFLDSFRERLHGRKRRVERALCHWRLWDHMDAILSLGVSQLARAITHPEDQPEQLRIDPERLSRLSRQEKRDLLLLAAFYDHSLAEPQSQRWNRLRRKLRFAIWLAYWDVLLGAVVTVATVAIVIYSSGFRDLLRWWVAAIIAGGWMPWLYRQVALLWTSWRVARQIRVFDHLPNTLRRVLGRFRRQEIAGQPIPSKDRSDDRYELLLKLQSILKKLGFQSVVVLVDRVDEPHLVNGSPERMRDLLWPMFDNKFLKHPGIGFKLLLPTEVKYYLDREEREFYERSRLDKQNLVPSLQWTGESLYDVANDRIRACSNSSGGDASLRTLFDESISEHELIGIFSRLRVPRHLFKFLYRVIVDHCNRFTDENPSWKISRETVHSTLALSLRDLEAFDRGMGTG